MAQARRLGPKVGSHLSLFYIYHVNQVNSCSTMNVVPVLLLFFIIIIVIIISCL